MNYLGPQLLQTFVEDHYHLVRQRLDREGKPTILVGGIQEINEGRITQDPIHKEIDKQLMHWLPKRDKIEPPKELEEACEQATIKAPYNPVGYLPGLDLITIKPTGIINHIRALDHLKMYGAIAFLERAQEHPEMIIYLNIPTYLAAALASWNFGDTEYNKENRKRFKELYFNKKEHGQFDTRLEHAQDIRGRIDFSEKELIELGIAYLEQLAAKIWAHQVAPPLFTPPLKDGPKKTRKNLQALLEKAGIKHFLPTIKDIAQEAHTRKQCAEDLCPQYH